VPLVGRVSGANRHDGAMFDDLLDAVPPSRTPTGHRRTRPAKLHADKGCDSPRCRQALRRRRITVRIARNGVESSERLGRHRWAVERTLAWLHRFRRWRVRDERKEEIHQAVLTLGCALICCAHLPAPGGF